MRLVWAIDSIDSREAGAIEPRSAIDCIARARQGDAAAWSELVQLHTRTVIVSLMARGLPFDRAQELTQQTWIRLVEQQRQGRLGELKLPALAVAQARFLMLEGERRRRGEGAVPLGEAPEVAQVPDPSPSPEARLLSGEKLRRAHAALDACSPSEQRVFRFVYQQPGTPHAEVAQRVGLSTQRVRQILCEVRKKLRAALEEP